MISCCTGAGKATPPQQIPLRKEVIPLMSSRTSVRQKLRTALFAMIAGILPMLLTGCSPNIALNQRYAYTSWTVNYGTPVSTEIGEYIDLDALSEEDRAYVEEHTELVYTGERVRGKDYDLPGKYDLTIYYDGRRYRQFHITVIDSEPPKFTRAEDVYTIAGYPYYDEEIEEMVDSMFVVEDNSQNVDLQITHDPIVTETAGDYTVHAVATDKAGNRTEADAVFHVQTPAYGMQGTYVFVSITNQMCTYFVDGEIVLETPVVTGTRGYHDTPTGVFQILGKGMYVTLKGRDYKVKVTYWMAFLGSEFGLHSAEWRGYFGGDIYTYNGSHGCVNMPLSAAAELYSMIEYWTPVIIVP